MFVQTASCLVQQAQHGAEQVPVVHILLALRAAAEGWGPDVWGLGKLISLVQLAVTVAAWQPGAQAEQAK